MTKGWVKEPARHSLAARGLKTGTRKVVKKITSPFKSRHTIEEADMYYDLDGNLEYEDPSPSCKREYEPAHKEHKWKRPISVVGGIAENPGCYGHGGGVVITEVCALCGMYREKDTWAQDQETGEQGLISIRYKPSDDVSEAWIDHDTASR